MKRRDLRKLIVFTGSMACIFYLWTACPVSAQDFSADIVLIDDGTGQDIPAAEREETENRQTDNGESESGVATEEESGSIQAIENEISVITSPGVEEGMLSRPSGYVENERVGQRLEAYEEKLVDKVDGNSVMQYVYNALRDNFGFSHAAACSVLANAYNESNFNYTSVGDGGTSYGLFQWHNTRWEQLKSWCNANGYDWTSPDGQVAYLRSELESGYKSVLDHLLAVDDSEVGAYDGAAYMCAHFEIPSDIPGQSASRGNMAIKIFAMTELRNNYREKSMERDETKSIWAVSNY